MRRGIGTTGALLLILVTVGARPLGEQLALGAGSRVWFDGKSTVRSFSCKATAIEGSIDVSGPAAVAGVLKAEKTVSGASLTFPVAKLDCENGTMNGHMVKALNGATHAAITFALTDYELAAGSAVTGTLRGTLTLNGVTKPISFPAEFAAAGDALRVTGSYALTMTEWQVTPPRLMMGAMKVDPVVTVRFDLQLTQH
jgi:polyisoprenoid-binding protein YceI